MFGWKLSEAPPREAPAYDDAALIAADRHTLYALRALAKIAGQGRNLEGARERVEQLLRESGDDGASLDSIVGVFGGEAPAELSVHVVLGELVLAGDVETSGAMQAESRPRMIPGSRVPVGSRTVVVGNVRLTSKGHQRLATAQTKRHDDEREKANAALKVQADAGRSAREYVLFEQERALGKSNVALARALGLTFVDFSRDYILNVHGGDPRTSTMSPGYVRCIRCGAQVTVNLLAIPAQIKIDHHDFCVLAPEKRQAP